MHRASHFGSFYRIVAISLSIAACARAQDLYVAPDGSDAHSGTAAAPLATLVAARDKIRTLKKTDHLPAGGITVFLRSGTYILHEPFVLTAEDSGTADSPITYRAAPAAKVMILGGHAISGDAFTPIQDAAIRQRIIDAGARDKILQVNLRELGITDYAKFDGMGLYSTHEVKPPSALYFDDKPMIRARWPNDGFEQIGKVIRRGSVPRNQMADIEPDKRDKGPMNVPGIFEYRGDRPSLWTHARHVWLEGFWAYDWADEAIPIGSIDVEKHQITLAWPHLYGIGAAYTGQGERYFAVNLLEEIDEPGEYYIDQDTNVLYFYPPAPLAGKDVYLSILTAPIIQLSDAAHVTVRGMTIGCGVDAAVGVTGGSDTLIAGCTINNVSAWGVKIVGGQRNGITGCNVYDTGAGGIWLEGGDQPTLSRCNNFAENNRVHDFQQQNRTVMAGVEIKGVGIRVAHNLVYDAPYQAIDWHGNFNVIEYNDVHDVCKETDDAGALHSDRDYSTCGNIIRYNYVHNVVGLKKPPGIPTAGAKMVYLDSNASGDEFIGNIFQDGDPVSDAIFINGGRDVLVQNNIFINTAPPVGISVWADDFPAALAHLKGIRYRQPPWSVAFPKLAKYPEDPKQLAVPEGNRIINNVFYHTANIRIDLPKGMSRDIVTIKDNYQAAQDPFVDLAHHDFRLTPSATAKIPNFKPVSFDKIGPQADEEGAHR